MFSEGNAIARISVIFFFSLLVSWQFSVPECSCHCVWSWSHFGPSHHLFSSLHISHPLLSRSAGFFVMNISPFDKTVSFDFSHLINNKCFNQCRTVVLCDHAYLFLAISLLRQVLAFSAKVADMCPTNNSRRAIVNFFLANLDLLAIKFWLNKFGWFTTAYAAVKAPVKLESLNKWISM